MENVGTKSSFTGNSATGIIITRCSSEEALGQSSEQPPDQAMKVSCLGNVSSSFVPLVYQFKQSLISNCLFLS